MSTADGFAARRRPPRHSHRIKIDRTFIRDVGVDERKTALVRSIAAFAASLGLETVAEGIETIAERDVVTESPPLTTRHRTA